MKGRWKEEFGLAKKLHFTTFPVKWSIERLDAHQITHGPLITYIRLATSFDTALFILGQMTVVKNTCKLLPNS